MTAGESATYATTLSVGQDHPSLPGHFPGQPVVPGVLLLELVLDAAETWLGASLAVRSLPQVKFIAPLLPGQTAHLELKRSGGELRFVVRRDDTPIAQGIIESAAAGEGEGAGA